MSDSESYEGDLQTNPNDLDREWLELAGTYEHWSTKLAEAIEDRDTAWLRKKVMKAKIFKEVKDRGATAGKVPSDSTADAEVHADPRYEAVSLALIAAEKKVNVLEGVKWGMEKKKRTLEYFTSKDQRIYGMASSITGKPYSESAAAINQESERIEAEVREKMKGSNKINRGK